MRKKRTGPIGIRKVLDWYERDDDRPATAYSDRSKFAAHEASTVDHGPEDKRWSTVYEAKMDDQKRRLIVLLATMERRAFPPATIDFAEKAATSLGVSLATARSLIAEAVKFGDFSQHRLRSEDMDLYDQGDRSSDGLMPGKTKVLFFTRLQKKRLLSVRQTGADRPLVVVRASHGVPPPKM